MYRSCIISKPGYWSTYKQTCFYCCSSRLDFNLVWSFEAFHIQYICICLFCLPQGIRFLIDSNLLKNTSDDIAQFLYKGEGLNKTAIGDYLGERWVMPINASQQTI